MKQPIAPDYGQQFLFPPALEDWVPHDHPVRFLREFVEQVDLAALGFVMPVALEGRPPYAPSLLLKIWLYGYFHRIRSTRKLEAAPANAVLIANIVVNSSDTYGGAETAQKQIVQKAATIG